MCKVIAAYQPPASEEPARNLLIANSVIALTLLILLRHVLLDPQGSRSGPACLPKQMPRHWKGFQVNASQQGTCTADLTTLERFPHISSRPNCSSYRVGLWQTLDHEDWSNALDGTSVSFGSNNDLCKGHATHGSTEGWDTARTVQSPFFGMSLNSCATTAICGGSWSLEASAPGQRGLNICGLLHAGSLPPVVPRRVLKCQVRRKGPLPAPNAGLLGLLQIGQVAGAGGLKFVWVSLRHLLGDTGVAPILPGGRLLAGSRSCSCHGHQLGSMAVALHVPADQGGATPPDTAV